MNKNLRLGIDAGELHELLKIIDIAKSRELALKAIKAEWAKDYATAEIQWMRTLRCCRPEKEVFCTLRAETCRKLTPRIGTLIF